MDNLRLSNAPIPHFDSKKSDVRQFFRRFQVYRQAYVPAWGNDVSINMLGNFIDDGALIYLESLIPEIRGDFELLRANLIEHYDSGIPLSTKWRELNQRKQGDHESVTNYYGALLKLSELMQLTPEQKFYVFINGLKKSTKLHLELNNPPANLADAFTRAKIYQSVNKTGKRVKSLLKKSRKSRKSRKEILQTSAATFDYNKQEIIKTFEQKKGQIVKQLTRCSQLNQLTQLTSQIPNLQKSGHNTSQNVTPFSPYPMDSQMLHFPFSTNESFSTYPSYPNNGDEFLTNQVNHNWNNPVAKPDFENHISTQKSVERENKYDDNNYNGQDAITDENSVTSGNCTVNYNPIEKKDTLCNFIDAPTLTLKGLLNQDTIILPHTEIDLFLTTEDITEHKQFQLKGLNIRENIIVYNNTEVPVTSRGIPCKISNFSATPVKLDNRMQLAWLKPLPFNILVCSETKENIPSHNDELSNLQQQDMVLSDIKNLFQPTEQFNVIDNDALCNVVGNPETVQCGVDNNDTDLKGILPQGTIIPSHTEIDLFLMTEENIEPEIIREIEPEIIRAVEPEIDLENIPEIENSHVVPMSQEKNLKLTQEIIDPPVDENCFRSENETANRSVHSKSSIYFNSSSRNTFPSVVNTDEGSSHINDDSQISSGNETHIADFTPSLTPLQTTSRVVPKSTDEILEYNENSFNPKLTQVIFNESVDVNSYPCTEDTKGDVFPKDYTSSRNSLFLKFYISCIMIYCMIFLLSISQFGFPNQVSSNILVGTKFYDHVTFTTPLSPEERLSPKHKFLDVTHNSVTIQKYIESFPRISLFLCSNEKAFFRIAYFFYSSERQMQRIILQMALKFGLNAIRYITAPFGRLKLF